MPSLTSCWMRRSSRFKAWATFPTSTVGTQRSLRFLSRGRFPARHDHVHELWFQFADIGDAAEFFAGDQSRPGAGEGIENDVLGLGGVAQHFIDERDRLHRRVILVPFRPRDFYNRGLEFLDREFVSRDLKPLVAQAQAVDVR